MSTRRADRPDGQIDYVSDPDGDDDEYCGQGFEDPTGWEPEDEEEDE
jgi:hypothetical protein